MSINPLSANPTKWSDTLKQQTIRRLLLTNCLSVFDHFVGLALKVLNENDMWWDLFIDIDRSSLSFTSVPQGSLQPITGLNNSQKLVGVPFPICQKNKLVTSKLVSYVRSKQVASY